eukprot:TRINITY_DN14631_c0_g1_i1.p1 TRINITY_DN14631_c0_g1~~TRINITY_DN14631_c0_g1_i1.p1  ORF type:complete len:197 (+),score=16.07 TRINITY_DN14631_c0_g1_i1:45-593(+)
MGGAQARACTCCVKRDAGEYQELPHLYRNPYMSQSSDASASTSYWASYQASEAAKPDAAPPAPLSLHTGHCIICREAPANTICLPCGHLLVCFRCSLRYARSDGSGTLPETRCPTCKQQVTNFQRVFLQSTSTVRSYATSGTQRNVFADAPAGLPSVASLSHRQLPSRPVFQARYLQGSVGR